MRPNIIKTSLSSALVYALTFFGSAYAADINTPGFTGTANHTVTSGFSIRSADYDCNLYTGYTFTDTRISTGLATVTRGNGEGCNFNQGNIPYWTDSYGNTATKYNNYHGTNPNNDDGSLNFGPGDIFSAKQKIFGSISGTTSQGLGVEVSYSAAYNPALNINSPAFKKLTSDAEDAFEQDFAIYDAYVTGSFDSPNGNFVDYQIGRFATSWGEATFIPVGANGLVTNALDTSKIRGPGASIREALMPTEQITVSTDIDGISLEAYYQIGAETVQVDPSGSYFGADFIGEGSGSLYAGGAYDYEIAGGSTCILSTQTGVTCDATSLAASRSNTTGILNQLDNAYTEILDNTAGLTLAAAQFAVTTFGSAAGDNGLGSDLEDNLVLTAGNATLGIEAGTNATASTETGAGSEIFYTAGAAGFLDSLTTVSGLTAYSANQRAGVEILPDAQKHVYADDGGEWGIRLGTYLDDVGTGVDLSFYYANYHSKAPYVRIKGMKNLFAGDYYGLIRATVTDNFGFYAANPETAALDGALRTNGGDTLYTAIQDVAYGSTICSAVFGGTAGVTSMQALTGDTSITKLTITDQHKALYMDRTFGTSIDGEKALIHNSAVCNATANGADALSGGGDGTLNDTNFALELTGAGVLAAITPLNQATYQFIYPEDNQIFGASFSTNVGSTTVQGEVSYRPDFPLATPASSQINQIADASGATQMLNWVAFTGLNALGSTTNTGLTSAAANATEDGVQALLFATVAGTNLAGGSANAYSNAVRDFKRSSLPAISEDTVKAGDYYSTPFIEYDVLSIDVGTTTSFTASDPVTVGLGADSAAIVTEIAMVQIQDLDNSKGYVNRGGFSAGGDDPAKCMGAVGTNMAPASGASVSNLGASIHDGLFGNGGYCENQPGADERSFSYRIVGTATYNNFNNTRWALSPNFAFAHDPRGYGPSSLGGFVEDRMSLSLGVNATSGGTSLGLSYVNYMGDERVGSGTDKDYITASVSHSF